MDFSEREVKLKVGASLANLHLTVRAKQPEMQSCFTPRPRFLLALLPAFALAAADGPLRLETPTREVGRYEMIKFRIEGVGIVPIPSIRRWWMWR